MATPFIPKHTARPSRDGRPRASRWHCAECNKLLGISLDGRMHLRFSRGHEYVVGFPVTATCRGCGTLNEAAGPAR